MAGSATILRADARALPLPDASVDSIVCDPPYALPGGFMGKTWDRFDEPRAFQDWCEVWAREAYRVLKPGGHLLAFGGSRTWHRLTCAIEDAGFEIRDSMAWHYGSGFPKSLNVSADDRFCRCDLGECSYGYGGLLGVRQGLSGVSPDASSGEVADLFTAVQRESARPRLGDTRPQGTDGAQTESSTEVRGGQPSLERRGDVQAGEGQLRRPEVRPLPSRSDGDGEVGRLRDGAPIGDGPLGRSAAAALGGREPHRPEPTEQHTVQPGAVPVERGPQAWRGWPVCGGCGKPVVPAGLGTALKPGFEPIVVARKPLIGTVAANVLQFGTGALNIDACRIEGRERTEYGLTNATRSHGITFGNPSPSADFDSSKGRWPTNVVLSHSPLVDEHDEIVGDACADGCVPGCSVAELDAQSGVTVSSADPMRFVGSVATVGNAGGRSPGSLVGKPTQVYGDSGGASRFFPTFRYEAKAPADERPRVDGVAHPTVKPLELIRWLCRLSTRPGGRVLDMFGGSGTTGEAALLEGFDVVAVENWEPYLPLIRYRLERARRRMQPGITRIAAVKPPKPVDGQTDLFADLLEGTP